jgi:AcrR family transcriptional regulator
MAQTGRPTDYHPGMAQALIAAAEGDTLGAATIPDIARVLGVSRTSVYDWLQQHKEFADAIVRARTLADAAVVSALRKRATGFDFTETSKTTQEGGGGKGGESLTKVTETEKRIYVAPDTAAAVFWLKNRDPEQWSDKTKVEVTGDFVEQVEAILKAKQGAS